MTTGRSFIFSHALCRKPSNSAVSGLRAIDTGTPDIDLFNKQHAEYVQQIRSTGAKVAVLDALEPYPDSVFIEDAALCLGRTAIVLRPGAPSRFGEAAALAPSLQDTMREVITLSGAGFVDGGDILTTDDDVFIGLSARTNQEGVDALSKIVKSLGYRVRQINTPESILHFKTDCGLLDEKTIFSSETLAATGCFEGYQVLLAPEEEKAAANLIRINDAVFINSGYPKTQTLLEEHNYKVVTLDMSEAAKLDAGLSCMSLRFSL